MSASREARTGDELAEVQCRCGSVYVRRHVVPAWFCRDCRQQGRILRFVILGPPGTEPAPVQSEVAS